MDDCYINSFHDADTLKTQVNVLRSTCDKHSNSWLCYVSVICFLTSTGGPMCSSSNSR